MDAAATRTQTLFVQIDHRLKKSHRPFSPTCFDFHMFFPALSHFLFLLLCQPPGAPAFHYRSQHFSAYTSDRGVFLLAGAGVSLPPTLRHAVQQQPRRPTRRKPQRLVAPATRYYQRMHAGLLCQVAGHVTHSEALPSSLTLMQSQCSSCALHTGSFTVKKVLFSSLPLCLSMHHPYNQAHVCSSCYLAVPSQSLIPQSKQLQLTPPLLRLMEVDFNLPSAGLQVLTRSFHDTALTIT